MKVVIIDDEEVSLFLSQQTLVLGSLAEHVHTFLFAEQALAFLKAGNEEDIPDLILLDLNMPVMNGWEFLNALAPHWQEFRKKCRIYILTSSLDYSDEAVAKDHPMVAGLMHKPINSESIRLINCGSESCS